MKTHTYTDIYFYTHVGFLGDTEVKNQPANTGDAGDSGLIPGLGRSPGEGNGNPFQYCCWWIPWTEEPGGLQCMGLQESNMSEATYHLLSITLSGWGRKKQWWIVVYLVYQRRHIVMVSNQIWVFSPQIQLHEVKSQSTILFTL